MQGVHGLGHGAHVRMGDVRQQLRVFADGRFAMRAVCGLQARKLGVDGAIKPLLLRPDDRPDRVPVDMQCRVLPVQRRLRRLHRPSERVCAAGELQCH